MQLLGLGIQAKSNGVLILDNTRYLRYLYTFDKHPTKRVDKINLYIRNNDTKGRMYITDIQLQEGKLLTGWVPKTEEMLKRKRDENGNIEPTKHFNALVREEANIIVPNRGNATTGLDWEATTEEETTGEFNIGTFYETRVLTYKKIIKKGQVITAEAARHILRIDDEPVPFTDYKGPQITAPSGDIMYKVQTHNRDAIRFVFKITEWDVREEATW